MSSPGTYPRCSAKSTDAPKYGALCSPLMKPSQTARETTSRLPMRASTTGSMKRAQGMALGLCPAARLISHSRTRKRHGLEQPINQDVGRDPFRLGVEVGDDAVPQHRMGERAHVLEAHVVAPAGQRARLAAEDQVLRSADAGPEG